MLSSSSASRFFMNHRSAWTSSRQLFLFAALNFSTSSRVALDTPAPSPGLVRTPARVGPIVEQRGGPTWETLVPAIYDLESRFSITVE
jgi:hypothetical protein